MKKDINQTFRRAGTKMEIQQTTSSYRQPECTASSEKVKWTMARCTTSPPHHVMMPQASYFMVFQSLWMSTCHLIHLKMIKGSKSSWRRRISFFGAFYSVLPPNMQALSLMFTGLSIGEMLWLENYTILYHQNCPDCTLMTVLKYMKQVWQHLHDT